MKKLTFISFLVLFFTTTTKAQIVLDQYVDSAFAGHHVYIGGNFYTTELSPTETKYVFLDDSTNTFRLLNMDFTPFLTNISVPEPFQMTTIGFQPIYITRALFDCDTSNIEFAYEAPTNCWRTFYVVRTDGTILLQVDSANGPYCLGGCLGMSDYTRPIRNTSAGTKLFLQHCGQGDYGFYIYSLCGTLITNNFDFTETNQSFVKIFPNPTANSLNFQITVPDNINKYELVLVDNNAKEVRRQKLNSPLGNYTINVGDLSSGTYYYSLCSPSKSVQTGKFVITK